MRQLIACTADTSLLDKGIYPPDVCERAREILADCGGSSLGNVRPPDMNKNGMINNELLYIDVMGCIMPIM